MATKRYATRARPPANTGVLGPHFYVDLVRLARKGWPTLARVGYLTVLLVALTFMYRTQGASVPHNAQAAEFARRALAYAYLLIVLQDLLVLVMLPVYVAGAIAEEKENQTLEALTLTHLSDTELVLGKLGGRLMHVGAVVLSGFPLLALMHLWGNVPIELLVYHEINTFLLMISAGSVCIWKSAQSESTFQAISGAYPLMALMGIFGMGAALVLPWTCGGCLGFPGGLPMAGFLPLLLILAFGHLAYSAFLIRETIVRMEILRREEKQRPRKSTGALTLTDETKPIPKSGKHGETRSRIHPLAWPIVGDVLWWKECLKDGTGFSLTCRWALITLAVIPLCGAAYQALTISERARVELIAFPMSATYSPYTVALPAYVLVVLFQMTMSVAAEREQGTLIFLMLIPEERRSILFAKWMGPWWRNWPILAIAWFGVLIGTACGVVSLPGALALLLGPLPLLLMLGSIALLLSVSCRRVLFANIALVGIMGLLFVAHVAAWQQTAIVLSFFIAVVGGHQIGDVMKDLTWPEAAAWAMGEQAVFLMIAALCLGASFWIFGRREYGS